MAALDAADVRRRVTGAVVPESRANRARSSTERTPAAGLSLALIKWSRAGPLEPSSTLSRAEQHQHASVRESPVFRERALLTMSGIYSARSRGTSTTKTISKRSNAMRNQHEPQSRKLNEGSEMTMLQIG